MEIKRRLRILGKKLTRVTRLKEPPEKIALGAAIGLFVNFIPTLGVGPFVTYFLARFFKASGVASVTFNLATGFFIPLYYSLNLITGRFLVGAKITTDEIGAQIGQSFDSSVSNIDAIVEKPWTLLLLDKLQGFTLDFLLGAVINGLVFGVVVYFVFVFLIRSQRKLRKKNKKNLSDVNSL